MVSCWFYAATGFIFFHQILLSKNISIQRLMLWTRFTAFPMYLFDLDEEVCL